MANPVFERALDGLATMVSARAARRVLEAGVRVVAETPDTISADAMQTLLLGYVHREFEQMLPREGLKHNLEQLAKRVGELSEASPRTNLPNPYDSSEVDAVAAALTYFKSVNMENSNTNNSTIDTISARADVSQVQDSKQVISAEHVVSVNDNAENDTVMGSVTNRRGSVVATQSSSKQPVSNHARAPDDQLIAAQDQALQDQDQSPQAPSPPQAPSKLPRPATSRMWQGQFDVTAKADKLKDIAPKGITMADSTETKLILSEAQLEDIVMHFAQVEHARLVAAVRENGSIVTSRGAGVDLNSLSRFGLMGLRLLERSGHLRSYYLSHTQGQLFLFCFGKDTVIMLGSTDINVGTVFSTLTSLKDGL